MLLPGIDGRGFLAAIDSDPAWRDTYVIGMSASLEALRDLDLPTLTKPIDLEDLIDAVAPRCPRTQEP
jgi:CheY-like chemotaxis protein